MFNNKHVIIALIVAPILSLIAYFGVDQMVSEKPHKAVAGNTYPLVAKSNCRYTSGICTMQNGDFELAIRLDKNTLYVTSPYSLSTVQSFLLHNLNEQQANKKIFQQVDDNGQEWALVLTEPPSESSQLRLVTIAAESIYYGETNMAFIDYKTVFEHDFAR
ncbi:hypothetical protein CBF23_014155 [Marinomonas agarivorans]|nr:hypothetical protein CBF23_014155 [Marinomonas agarivorans]